MGSDDRAHGDIYGVGIESAGFNMIKNFNVNLAYYKPIQEWDPKVGDVLIKHNFLTHWFGIVSQVEHGVIMVIAAGLPKLLLTMGSTAQDKSKVTLDVADIVNSRAGKYAAISCIQNNVVWHV
jgi:hypothetical protein